MEKDHLIISALSLLTILVLSAPPISAQWSSDPYVNLAISDTTGEQVTAKMVATSDSGCYISWFDNRDGSYCMYMQRLNSLGEAQWTPNGMLISDHAQSTSLVDYDLTADHNDNAVVVFTDTRNGGSNDLDVFAYKIAPDGSFLWGPNGVGLSETVNSNFEPAPKVTATSEGNFVVGWMKSGASDVLCFQKISSDGQKLWGDNGITILPGVDERLASPDLVPAENDTVIAYWKNSTGPFWAPTTRLYTQKFAPDGGFAWGASGVLIYDLGVMSAWTYPEIQPDGNGGAFYTWYDSPSLSSFTVRVQHVDADGNLVFPLNGIEASTNSNDRLHMNPSLSFMPSTNELYVFWVEENWNQNQYGLYGQKFSPAGARLWSDSGLELIRIGDDQIHFINSGPADTSIYVGYFESPSAITTAVKAFLIDRDGNLLWNPVFLSSQNLGGKDDLLMVVNTENRAFLAWTDDRGGDYDIFAQNVNFDGSLGNQASHASQPIPPSPDRFVLGSPYPNPFNAAIAIPYEVSVNANVRIGIYNLLGQHIATLLDQSVSSGSHTAVWNAGEFPSGIYFCRMEANGFNYTRKLLLLK